MGYCHTLYGRNIDATSGQSSFLANTVRSYRKQIKKVVEDEAKEAGVAGVTLHYLDATDNLFFEAEDMANDCFHLSSLGQAKIADRVFNKVQSALGR